MSSSHLLPRNEFTIHTNGKSNPSIPILTLRLLEIQIPKDPSTKKLLLNGAKDLIKAYPKRTAHINPQIFHNKDIIYSGIQIDQYQGAIEWTAIGEKAVNTLQKWYELFQEEHPVPLKNVVEIKEQYTPEFLPYLKKYTIPTILISDTIAKELNHIKNPTIRNNRMERYLYGNLQTFFRYTGFSYPKEVHFLKVCLLDIQPYKQALPIYHQQKKTAFQLSFKCNFRLPQTLRIGQSTALGYGKIYHV